MPPRRSTPLCSSGAPDSQQGQGVVEYTLVICLVAVTLVVVLLVLGEQIAHLLTAVSERIASLLNGAAAVMSG